MARSTFLALLTIAGAGAASPAVAQFPNIFDSLFGNPPAAAAERRAEPAAIRARRRSRNMFRRPAGRLAARPPPGSRIQTEPLPPPPGGQRAAPCAARRSAAPGAPPAGGQRPPAQPARPAAAQTKPSSSRRRHKIANPTAVFSGLDKITGRIISFDVAINETVRFGALEVTPRACYTRPPTEAPTTDGFIEVDELTLQGETQAHLHRLDVCREPGPQRGRASDLRRVADRL